MEKNKLDLTNSKLPLELQEEERLPFSESVQSKIKSADGDVSNRKKNYDKRRDFVLGNHEKYTNISGLTKKAKKGHADQVNNYVGRSAVKIYHAVGNNEPNVKILPSLRANENESSKAQAIEDFVSRVFWYNKFWKRGYKRATMNQVVVGDFAVKVYWDSSVQEIKIIQAERMENLIVGWRSDDGQEYDWVAHKEMMSISSIKDKWGIETDASQDQRTGNTNGTHGDEYGIKAGSSINNNDKDVPTQPMAEVIEFCNDKIYSILINGEVAEYVTHGYGFNPWVIGHSLHICGKSWSKSYIDDLISPNIELNESNNDQRDYIRTASNAKYVAKNMDDFDPESIKPGSGQVIFVNGQNSDFTSLASNVNTYPVDTYASRMKDIIHDMLVPQVGFGGGTSSGRKGAIDFQTIVDVVDDLRDGWELVLDGVIERIQRLGYMYLGNKFFENEQGEFEIRITEYDWEDIRPISQSDKIVDILNKFNMGLPFETVFDELGYKDPKAMVALMKTEAEDPLLVGFRGKLYQQLPGGVALSQDAMEAQQANNPQMVNQPSPTLVSSQNEGRSLPMSVAGGQTSTSTLDGTLATQNQNLTAQGL